MTRRFGLMTATALLGAALSGCIYVGGTRHYHEDDDYYNRDRYNSGRYDGDRHRNDRYRTDHYRNDTGTYRDDSDRDGDDDSSSYQDKYRERQSP